ncbi:hypothetical protein BBJ28_00005071 [Nothophytophthora sp. Chile5]|nr:hypothetical protein BBJ28_00005071 [Nothophytophthora sp. Chile5]
MHKQRKRELWQFVVCVADEKFGDVPDKYRGFQQEEQNRKAQVDQDPLTNLYAASVPTVTPEVPAGAAEQCRADDLLATWVASSLRPASIVEGAGFVTYMNFVNSVPKKLSIPARQTVTARIRSKAAELRASLKIRLVMECDFYSASSDIWTSLSAESFMSFTLNCLDADYNMNGWTLEVESLPGKHDTASIGAALTACFER